MKSARYYITTIRKGLSFWDKWLTEGETYLQMDKQIFLNLIEKQSEKLRGLEAQDVKDDLLEREDGIELRLKRLDEYKLQDIIQFIVNTQGNTAHLSDAETNEAIDRYRLLIEDKTKELLKVIKECERYIPSSKNPVVEEALNDPQLLSYFFGSKKELEAYILFCSTAKNAAQMGKRAGELCKEGKINYDHLNKDLHDKLQTLGFDVKTNNNWKQATLKGASR